MTKASKVGAKKLYNAPKLIVYGDLTQLTMTAAMMGGMFDNIMLTKRT
jgi:hypothetical protein